MTSMPHVARKMIQWHCGPDAEAYAGVDWPLEGKSNFRGAEECGRGDANQSDDAAALPHALQIKDSPQRVNEAVLGRTIKSDFAESV